LSARRRIPSQARLVKKYRCGNSPVSRISDNEDTAASLGNSEILAVQNSPREPIPELPQRFEEDAEVSSVSGG